MLFLDTSALLKRYVLEEGTDLVLESMAQDGSWTASALAQAETEVTLCHLGLSRRAETEQRRRLRADWERFLVVPVDGRCLLRATEVGCQHRVRTLDAIHLAAAERLPGPLSFLTFDLRQAAAAQAMSLEVRGAVE
jgi:predicted nucleic acid-binding protein